MNSQQMRDTILNKIKTDLPSLLLAVGLNDFDKYITCNFEKADDLELIINIIEQQDSTDQYNISFMVSCQLYQIVDTAPYDDVIFEYLKQNIKPDLIEMVNRTNIKSDIWPIDNDSSTSFIHYYLEFNKQLDDCDY